MNCKKGLIKKEGKTTIKHCSLDCKECEHNEKRKPGPKPKFKKIKRRSFCFEEEKYKKAYKNVGENISDHVRNLIDELGQED